VYLEDRKWVEEELETVRQTGTAGRLEIIYERALEGGNDDAHRIGTAFGIGERGLRRLMKRLGTSHRKERDRARFSRAIPLLQGASLSLSEIAQKTGYQRASAFSHAFSRWFGEPPARFRRRYRPLRRQTTILASEE